MIRQLVYISTLRSAQSGIDTNALLHQARRNNARDGITGLLFFNGKRFLQALEGSSETVEAVFARIKADERHLAIVALSDRMIAAREFGSWAMAYRRPGESDTATLNQIADLVAGAAPAIRSTFEGYAEFRPAA